MPSLCRTVKPFAKNSLPNGMHFLIDVEAFDYSVSTTGSEGIILSILHQLDIPIMKNIGINVQPGQDVQIAVTPTLISTNKEAKRRFEPVRRQCYFEDEISLFHFPVEDGYRWVRRVLKLTYLQLQQGGWSKGSNKNVYHAIRLDDSINKKMLMHFLLCLHCK